MLVLVSLGFMITRIVFHPIPSEFLKSSSTANPATAVNINMIRDSFR